MIPGYDDWKTTPPDDQVPVSILGTLGVSCYILADTFFVSAGLGAKGLATLNLAIPGLRLFLMTYSCAS